MQSAVNFVRGSVLLEVKSSYPERFFNLCARHGIEFWDMTNDGLGVFRIRMTVKNFKRIRPVARKAMCRVHIVKRCGLPFFLNRFRKRAALISGCAVFCIIAWIFTSFVWVIDIDGYAELDTARLLNELSKQGLRVGTYAPSVEMENLKNNILIDMPELSYISVNINGSHAHVTARKRTLPPEILPSELPCDIISDKDGIIHDITVKSGTPEVVRGETVTRGQILASGYVTGRAGTTITTHADAEIRARVWRKKSARMPKKYSEKVYTGREKDLYTILLFDNRIKLYINSGISYTKCDKIIKRTDLRLFGRYRLPISLERATCREYEISKASMSDETAYDSLSKGLMSSLELPEDAEVINADFITSSDEVFAYATLTAESIEPIGTKREILRNG